MRWKIDTRLRAAAFLAQIGHESGQLRVLVENLSYSADALVRTWPNWCWWLIAMVLVAGGQQCRVMVANDDAYAARLDLAEQARSPV